MVGCNGLIGGIYTGSKMLPSDHNHNHNPQMARPTTAKRVVSTRCQSQAQEMRMKCEAESLYDVLGISSGATNQEIKASYRRLARLFHPDTARFSSAAEKHKSTQHFIKIRNAYSTLSDSQSRAGYDRRRFGSTVGGYFSKVSYQSQFVGRNWETDQCW